MGKDIHVRIIKRNRNKNVWEEVKLYYKENGNLKDASIYPGRNYDLFDILGNKNNDDFLNTRPIFEPDLPEDLKEEIKIYQNSIGFYDFKEINLADLKIYLHHMPKIIKSYGYEEEDDPNTMKDNPVKYFIERIEYYLDFADVYDFLPPSDIKIIYWFDR